MEVSNDYLEQLTDINVKSFKRAFYEIKNTELKKTNLHRSTMIYYNIDKKIKTVDNNLDNNLRIIFSESLNDLNLLSQEQFKEELYKALNRQKKDFKKELDEALKHQKEDFKKELYEVLNHQKEDFKKELDEVLTQKEQNLRQNWMN